MSAVLIVLVARYGLEGIWVAGLFSGAILLVIGLLRLGRFIAFIPSAVISGFTSGIALIIFIGQIDNFLGVKTAPTETAAQKLLGYFHGGFTPDFHALAIGLVVIVTMLLWPTKWNARFPASLLGIILATLLSSTLGGQSRSSATSRRLFSSPTASAFPTSRGRISPTSSRPS
jgi:SulP family sulfate permease